jgi:hypothetical protein
MGARLRKWFGPSREEIWKQLSAELGGQYVPDAFWKRGRVEASHGEWTITFDTYVVSTGKVTVVYTRVRAPYVNPDGFRFNIYRKGFFSGMGKMLGMQDIEIGVEPFDTDFIVKANDESKVRNLLSNERVRDLIAGQPEIKLEVKDDEGWFGAKFPEGVDELLFMQVGVIKDVERLKHLYELFAATLDELCRIGSAYESKPEVTL